MYLVPDMIDIATSKRNLSTRFKTKFHRQVAINIVIGNPEVNIMDTMCRVVKSINEVPNNRIKNITYKQLVEEFDMPDVGIYR